MRLNKTIRWTAAAVVLLLVLSIVVSASASAAPTPVDIGVAGTNGQARQTEPGLRCPTGEGSYRHYLAESKIPGGVVSSLAGMVRSTFDVHYESAGRDDARAFLLGQESHATVSNERGTITYTLRSGSCESPSMTFVGVTVMGSGNGTPITGTGAYRGITGSATFSMSAETNPGADNDWSLEIRSMLDVLQPDLTLKVRRTYWAHLGLDYVNRVVSVDYHIANSGPGDAFGVMFLGAPAGVSGVRVCGEPYSVTNPCSSPPPGPIPLGDLESCTLAPDGSIPSTCDSEVVTVRYHLDPLMGPCTLVLVGCTFPTTATVRMPDALDVATNKKSTQTIVAPLLPPPL